jgi:hypothetical protein
MSVKIISKLNFSFFYAEKRKTPYDGLGRKGFLVDFWLKY